VHVIDGASQTKERKSDFMLSKQTKTMSVSGWCITVLIVLLMTASGAGKIANPPTLAKQMTETFGYPDDVTLYIGIVEICCAVLFLNAQTTILGAVLLTGYLGGAIATHVRIQDNFVVPAIIGVLVWLGVFLRDARVRALLPIQRSASQ
jgi:DoxX-like family